MYSVRQWPKISIFAPAGKTMRWIEKWLTPFRIMSWRSLNSMQSLREIELRAPAVGAKIGVFCMSRLVCLRVGDIVQTSIVWRFMSRFFMPFSAMFWEGTALSGALHGSHLHSPGVATIFREIAVKNYEKSRNRRKRLCAPLRIDSWEIWRKFHCSSLGQKM